MLKYPNNAVRNALIVFAAFVIMAAVASVVTVFHKSSYSHCLVTGKDRTTDHDNKSHMRIYSSCGTFKVSDSLITARWDSADVYGKIEVNKTYDFTSRGFRIPLTSTFPNIDTVKEIN